MGHSDFARWEQELTRLIIQFAGRGAFLPQERDPQDTLDVAVLRTQVEEGERLLKMLMRSPQRSQRSALHVWVQELFGLQGVLGLAAAEVDALSIDQADASLDSELSLLWWDRDQYSVARRIPNPLYVEPPSQFVSKAGTLPVLMVSRVDAPTSQLAMQLVDQAITSERQG